VGSLLLGCPAEEASTGTDTSGTSDTGDATTDTGTADTGTDDTGTDDTGTDDTGTDDTGTDDTGTDDTGTDTGGGCESDVECSDNDPCTYDQCNGGKCANPADQFCATNSPCQASDVPGSDDESITECVCALDGYCCDIAWDELCVGQADSDCGAPCACDELEPAELACLSDDDCLFCDDGDACNGSWGCSEGTCVQTDPVQCDPELTTGCMVNSCNPFTGACELTPDIAQCDDTDPCTSDTCEASGECGNEALEGCGENHPCQTANTPGSKDDDITACVCALDSFCCNVAWDSLCVGEAQNDCGAVCDCSAAEPETLTCEDDSDCSYCDDPNDKCLGIWTCGDEGLCVTLGAVECDDTDDFGCVKNTCNPVTGICSSGAVLADCVDADLCTLDACDSETGECTNELQEGCGENHPCQEATTPGSKNEEINTCVCEFAPECCDDAWASFCTFLAQDFCALSCDCSGFVADDLACDEDSDCDFCDADGDLCNGSWTCQDGTCGTVPVVECDGEADIGCATNQCQPETGECALAMTPDGCNDGDNCSADTCDLETGECSSEPIVGCGTNHPCQTSLFVGTADKDVEACVCALDSYCCETAWDGLCVNEAQDQCDVQCDCAAAAQECVETADCGFCDNDSTLCNGGWICEDGACVTSEAVDCGDPDADGCLLYKCIAETGECDYAAVDAYCDDGDDCTLDSCDEVGECSNDLVSDECGETDPCIPSEIPASNNPPVNACVCLYAPECCESAWSDICVQIAVSECTFKCTCKQTAPECEADADCSSCDDDNPCNGSWSCVDGVCEEEPAVLCEADGDAGCDVPGCNPENGECEYLSLDSACNDNDPCTAESCVEGLCQFESLESCGGGDEPPFPGFPGEPTPEPNPG